MEKIDIYKNNKGIIETTENKSKKEILEHKNKSALFQVRTYNWGCSYKVERQYMNYGRGLLFCYGSIQSALARRK